jgi:putative ABC transport system substrate-binding protein
MRPGQHYCGIACALVLAFPVLALAQQSSSHVPLIGVLQWSPCDPIDENSPFRNGLRDLGYKPGENIKIECRSADGQEDQLPVAAAELAGLEVDVIVSFSEPVARAAYKATDKIPIVSIFSGDPVASDMARSLSQPGGNVTGVSYYATELTGKRLDLLNKAMPELTTIEVLANPAVSYLPFEEDTKRAADKLGLEVRVHNISKPSDLESAFSTMRDNNAQAVFVLPDLMLAGEASRIATLALEHKLPTMAWGFWYVDLGCLMAYSTWYPDHDYRLAFYVDRILKGARPGDLPIEQPTKYILSINLKTAAALSLELPQTLLLSADNFVE